MTQPIAVLTADTHLTDRAWAHRPIEGDAYYSFKQIMAFAIKYALPVVGAGDLLDRHILGSGPVVRFHRQLDALGDAGLVMHFVQGQHELSRTPWFSSHRHARHVHGTTFDLGGVRCYGLDYQPAGQLQEALDGIPEETDVLIAHQVWSDFMGDIASPQGGFHDVPRARLVFTGDYHQYQDVVVRGKDGQELRAVSPGSAHMLSVDEPPEKYFCVLLDDLSIRRIKLHTRPVVEHLLSSDHELTAFLDAAHQELDALDEGLPSRMPETVRRPICRITYPSRLQEVPRRVQRAIGDRVHLFWKEQRPASETPERGDGETSAELAEGDAWTLESTLPRYLEEQGQDSLLDVCARLLATNDPSVEVRRMRDEALSEDTNTAQTS